MLGMITPFTLEQYGRRLSVQPLKSGGFYVFVIQFPDGKPKLAITRRPVKPWKLFPSLLLPPLNGI